MRYNLVVLFCLSSSAALHIHWQWTTAGCCYGSLLDKKPRKDNLVFHFARCVARMWNFVSHRQNNTGWGRSNIGSWGRYLGLRGRKWQGTTGDCVMSSLPSGTHLQILIWLSNQEEWKWQSMWHIWGEEICTQSSGGETCGKSALRRPRSRWKDNKIRL